MILSDVRMSVLNDASRILKDVYKYRWNFKDVSDFILVSYVCDGSISDFKDFLELRNELIKYFRTNLRTYIDGGVK